MRAFLILNMAVLLAASLAAQPTLDWDATPPSAGTYPRVDSVHVDSSNRINVHHGDNPPRITQYDADGNVNWTVSLTAAGATDNYVGGSITDAADNIYAIFTGYDSAGPTWDEYIVKLDSSGNELWRTTATGVSDPGLAVDASNNLLVMMGGSVRSFSAANGTLNWTFQATGIDHGSVVAVDATGNIHASGTGTGTTDTDVGIWIIDPTTGTEVRSSGLQDSGLGPDSDRYVIALPGGGTALVGIAGSDVGFWLFDNTSVFQNFDSVPPPTADWHDFSWRAPLAARAPTGEFIVVGGTGGFNYFAYGFDANGDSIWSDNNGSAGVDALWVAVHHPIHGFVTGGGFDSGGTSPVGRLRSYDPATGGVNWTEDWAGTPGDPIVSHLALLSSGDLVVAGSFWDNSGAAVETFAARYNFPAGPTPELEVSRTGVGLITDGGNDPIAASADGMQVDLKYVLENVGNATLNFGATAVSAVATQGAPTVNIASGPAGAGTLAANATVDLDLEVTPTAVGAWTVTVTINSDGSTGGSHVFTITGNATAAPTPLLQVQRTHPGGTSTLAHNGTDTVFGTVDGQLTTLTYDLTNVGTGTLTFAGTSVTVTAGTGSPAVALVGIPTGASTLAASASTSFDVQITPASDGAWTATLEIHSDGTTGGTHTITLSGTAQAAAAPLMSVLQDTNAIANGGADGIPGSTGTAAFTRTFSIRNEGSAALTLTGTPAVVIDSEVNCAVTVTTQPASNTVAAGGGTVTFTVQIDPDVEGAFSFEIVMANDATTGDYTFTVSGDTGTTPPPPAGDSKDKDSGCSTGDGASWHLALVLALLGLWLSSRSRRATPSSQV